MRNYIHEESTSYTKNTTYTICRKTALNLTQHFYLVAFDGASKRNKSGWRIRTATPRPAAVSHCAGAASSKSWTARFVLSAVTGAEQRGSTSLDCRLTEQTDSTTGSLNSALLGTAPHPKHVLCSSRDSLHRSRIQWYVLHAARMSFSNRRRKLSWHCVGLAIRSGFSWSQIAIATASRKIKDSHRATESNSQHHLLPRSDFLLVPLGRAGVGGVEAPLR